MKNLIFIAIAAIFAAPAMAQPVSDRGVIPVAVTLNQILRLNITGGGNIEFVFNTITQYESGITNATVYDSDFNVASSTAWELDMGAEDATFIGTDNPANTMALNNVGFIITESGVHDFGTELTDPAGANAGVIALAGFAVTVIGSGALTTNGGDILDNVFVINWECGTTAGSMNATAIIDQVPSIAPDRYVTNVLLDLRSIAL